MEISSANNQPSILSTFEPTLHRDDSLSTDEGSNSLLVLDSCHVNDSTSDTFNQGPDLIDTYLNNGQKFEELEKDDVLKNADGGLENDSQSIKLDPLKNHSVSPDIEENQSDVLENTNPIRSLEESVSAFSDKNSNDDGFVTYEEYAKLLFAYQEKVAQVEELKIQLSKLLKE